VRSGLDPIGIGIEVVGGGLLDDDVRNGLVQLDPAVDFMKSVSAEIYG
jgi:hypothetical protein